MIETTLTSTEMGLMVWTLEMDSNHLHEIWEQVDAMLEGLA